MRIEPPRRRAKHPRTVPGGPGAGGGGGACDTRRVREPTSNLQPLSGSSSVLRGQQQQQPPAFCSSSTLGIPPCAGKGAGVDWCLWATTTSTNNRKSVVAINLHACLLLLEGQGLWGSMSSFSKAGRLPKCNSQPKTVAFWKVGHQPPSVQSSSVPVPFARTNVPRDAPVVSRGGDGSYQMDGNSSSADAGWKGPVQDKQVRQPMNGWLAGEVAP